MDKVKTGIIGCGNISGIYIENLSKKFANTQLAAVSDLVTEKAKAVETEHGIKACTVDEMLSNPDIEIIVNLTTPQSHFDVNMAALNAGKHVYCEKPLAIERRQGAQSLELAKEKGLHIGGAPDTFLGAGIQTCIKLINDGWIGKPIAATAFMMCRGHESWHPDPEFYYKIGGGPMFDMGPYYLTALISMLGSVKRVCASANISFPARLITSEKKYGTVIDVEVPTHIAGILDFQCGAIGSIITSFDVWAADVPRIEIYGSEGTLSVPDPNTFGGSVKIKSHRSEDWHEIPLTHDYAENSRGLGVSDMADAIRNKRACRASGELTYHVLDIMHGFHEASGTDKYYVPVSRCEKPAPLTAGMGVSMNQ